MKSIHLAVLVAVALSSLPSIAKDQPEPWKTSGVFEFRDSPEAHVMCLYSEEQIVTNLKNKSPGNSSVGTLCMNQPNTPIGSRMWVIDLPSNKDHNWFDAGDIVVSFQLSNNLIIKRTYGIQLLQNGKSIAKISSLAEPGSFESLFVQSKHITISAHFRDGDISEHYKVPTIRGGND